MDVKKITMSKSLLRHHRRYVFRRRRAENERSHVAAETGMLKQDFSGISVSLNNSWVTGGIEIRVLAMTDVVSVRCLMSLNKLFSILS